MQVTRLRRTDSGIDRRWLMGIELTASETVCAFFDALSAMPSTVDEALAFSELLGFLQTSQLLSENRFFNEQNPQIQ
jgi:hypothetical protein